MPETASLSSVALLPLLLAEPLVIALLGAAATGAIALLLFRAEFGAWRKRAYATRVAWTTCAASLAATALLALTATVVDMGRVTLQVAGRAQQEDARLARRMDSWLAAQRDQLNTLALDLPRGGAADGEAIARRFEQYLLANVGVRSMLAVDADGRIYVGVRRATNARGTQRLAPGGIVADRIWFAEVMRTGSVYMPTDFAPGVIDSVPVLAMAAPVGSGAEAAGAVQAALLPAALAARLDVEERAAPTELAIVDSDQRVLQASEGFGTATMQPVTDPTLLAELASPAPLRIEAGARPRLYAHARLANGWRVVSRTDLDAELAPARRRGALLCAAFALLVVGIAFGIPRMVRRLSDPLRMLGQGMAGFDPARSRAALRAPRTAPHELRSLFAEYAVMQRRLTRADRTVRMQMVEESRQRRAVEAGLAQRNAELTGVQNQLRALVRTDALTGVANHRALREHLKFACGASRRIGKPLSLVLIDVDRFKGYNDEYGHPAGDACLCAVADALCEVARRSLDMVARHGGAQFAMVLAVTSAEQALLVAEKARAAVAKLAIEDRRSPKGLVTVTLGVATSYPENELDPDGLLAHAGAALGTAKQAGRDCVSFASDGAPKPAPVATPHEESVTLQGGLPRGFLR